MLLTSPPGLLLGARSPRVELHPPYELTYGPVAVDLTRRAGQILDPWQGDSLDVMLGLRHDDKWACFEFAEWVSRQNGKGGIGEARVLVGFVGPLDERLILWSAHEYKTAMEAFRRIGWLLRNLGYRKGDNLIIIPGENVNLPDDIPIKVINTNGEESYERLDTGQRVRFVARTKGSGRGFSGDVNLIDEAFAYEFLHQSALMPTLSARPNPQIVYLSSPPLNGFTGEVMFQLRRRALAGGDDSLGYRDWGLDGDLDNLSAIDLDDQSNYARTNPAVGIRITMETIIRERRSMSPADFARERMGIWPADLTAGYAVIPELAWKTAEDTGSELSGAPAFAVDAYRDPTGTRAAIGVAGRRKDGLTHVELVDGGAGTGWVVRRVVELRDRWKPCAIVVDPGGPAGSLIADLEAAGVEVVRTATRDVAHAYGQFVDGICGDEQARTVRHLGQPELTAAVAGATRRQVGDGHAWDRRTATVDITPLVAVTNALWGFAVHGHVQPVTPWIAYA